MRPSLFRHGIKRLSLSAVAATTLALALACGPHTGTLPSVPKALAAAAWWQPTPSAPIHWQWQIGTPFNISTDVVPNVGVYDIDLFDTPASVVSELHRRGFIVIAYVSFGTYENWRPDKASFPATALGKSNGWPGENWLDIRDQTVRTIMAARIDLAKSKGFDAVEPDNVDGYSNSTGFPLTAQDQINYNTWIATQCHSRGMSVGLKNDVEQAAVLEPYFDWALNEESYQYDEYSALTAFTNHNKAVFEVEYGNRTAQSSAMNGLRFNSMTRDLNLVSPGSSGYLRKPCIPDSQNTWGTPSVSPPVPSPVNRPPVLGLIGDKTVGVGSSLSFTVSATDPDGDRMTFSATNLPKGASFDLTTHVFTWIPYIAGAYAGSVFSVSDGQAAAAETISITVSAIPSPPAPVAGSVTATVASVPLPTGGSNEYSLYLKIVSTTDSRFGIGQQVWCSAQTTDFPALLNPSVTLKGTLNDSLGWWVLKAGAPIASPITSAGTVTATVASVPTPTGGSNEYGLSLKVVSTTDSRFVIGQQVWCAARTTDFPSLLTSGTTLIGTLNNSLGWWVLAK